MAVGVSLAFLEVNIIVVAAAIGLATFLMSTGGMKKRLGLVRLLAYDPEVLLLDEPFGALDAQTREQLQDDLLALWRDFGKTVVFVTHDLVEAINLADRIILMSARPGRIAQARQPAAAPWRRSRRCRGCGRHGR